MKTDNILKELLSEKKRMFLVVLLGAAGLLLILISSLLPGQEKKSINCSNREEIDVSAFCRDTEERLEGFLSSIEGAGRVSVYLTVGSEEQYIYAKEAKRSRSDNRYDEEEKYVMVGGGSDKNALVETVRTPEITGAVIACSGCDSPAVRERIYKAVSAALGINAGKIYVTKLE